MNIKKISIEQLEPGMYVHDLNWSANSSLLSIGHFLVCTEWEVLALRNMGVCELYIDTVLGDNVADAPTMQDVRHQLEAQLLELGQVAGLSHLTDFQEEIENAKSVHDSAATLISNLMRQVRTGKIEDVGHELLDLAHELTHSISRNPDALISISQVRNKDDYTFLHCAGSAVLMGASSRMLQLGNEIGRHLVVGALLHDVGKMRVPTEILNKPGRLTPGEFKVVKQHVKFGEEILSDLPQLSEISWTVARQHHERLDGSGYPSALRGTEISQFGQMAAIVDAYDSLTSERVYDVAMEPVEVTLKLLEWGGQHLNKELVKNFVRTVGVFPSGTLVRLATGRLAVVVNQGKEGGTKPTVRMVYDTQARREIKPDVIDLSDGTDDDKIIGWEPWEKWEFAPQKIGQGAAMH